MPDQAIHFFYMAQSRQPAILFIFITLLIDCIGFGVIIPVLPKLISELTGEGIAASAKYGGWLLFSFSLFQFVFSPILGNLSDKYGRRPILLFSLFGFGLDYLFLGFAPTLGWLFVGRIIAGITGASFSTAQAYIADVSTPENKAQNFGMVGAAFGLGFIIGPVLGGILGEYGARVPFFAAAGLSMLNFTYGFFILPESLPVENRRSFDWRKANPVGSLLWLKQYPLIFGLVTALFFIYMSSHAVQSVWSYFSIDHLKWSESEVGYSLGFVGVLVALVQVVLVKQAVRIWGSTTSIYIGLSLLIVGLVTFSFASAGWMMYAGLVPYCLSGLAGPNIQSDISNHIPPNAQGALQGALTSLVSITAIVGPPLMANLYATFAKPGAGFFFPGMPFMVGAVFALTSLVVAWLYLRKEAEVIPEKVDSTI